MVPKPRFFSGDDAGFVGDVTFFAKIFGDGRDDVGLAFLSPDVGWVWPNNWDAGITWPWSPEMKGLGKAAGVSGAKPLGRSVAVCEVNCD